MVTTELVEEKALPTSGFSNDELTAEVSDFVDKMPTIGEVYYRVSVTAIS